jgi:ring-1,2-phenylacetyl-CoA epoxidase subunit PaaC
MPSTSEAVAGVALADYTLALADDALILAQRLSESVAHGPEIEEEVALANIGLDLLGQARLLYARAALADPALVPELPPGSPAPAEDALAFFREPADFRNVRLAELPRGDFAFTMVRLLALSGWRLALLRGLATSADPVLAAVAAKGIKEVSYHYEHAARWTHTLAHGTEESRRRTTEAFLAVHTYLVELSDAEPETADQAEALWTAVIDRCELPPPRAASVSLPGGRSGVHTEALAPLVAELQSVARAHPMGQW